MKFLSGLLLGVFFSGAFHLQHKTELEVRALSRLDEEITRNKVCGRALDILSVKDKWLKIFALREAAGDANKGKLGQ